MILLKNRSVNNVFLPITVNNLEQVKTKYLPNVE
mgnify:CR=1 FL=1